MHLLNKFLIFLVGIVFSTHLISEETIQNKWRLKDEVLESEDSSHEAYSKHTLKFGLGTKNLKDIELKGNQSSYFFKDQDVPGLEMAYEYDFDFNDLVKTAFYTNLGYFTRYNKLSEGYVDFSILGVNGGLSIGYVFFEKNQIIPKVFLGMGSSYYFQRGDNVELSANESIQELEYGIGFDLQFKGENPYPDSWGNHLILSVQYSKFNGIGKKEIEGDKVLASLGVLL